MHRFMKTTTALAIGALALLGIFFHSIALRIRTIRARRFDYVSFVRW